MSNTLHQFRYGANFKIVGKTEPQNLSYAGAFNPVTGTFKTLAAHIGAGHPSMPAILSGNGKRWQSNANHAEIVAADIDDGMTIAQALEHPFIKAHCGLGIESASSCIVSEKNPDGHEKFRLIFRLENPLKDWQTIRIVNRYLIEQLGTADPACKDASRFFFGAPGRIPFLLNDDAFLPQSFVDEAIAWHQELERKAEEQARIAQERWHHWQAENPERDEKALILEALSYVNPDCEYTEWLSVGMTLTALFGSEGVSIWDSWSAGSSNHKPGECDRKARSFRNVEPRIGQLLNLAKQGGFQFSKREKWKDDQEPGEAAYQAYLNREREAQRIEQAQQQQSAFDGIKKQLAKLPRPFSGRGFQPLPLVPNSDVVIVGSHAEGHLLADEQGTRVIVNVSGTGSFKSSFYAHTTPEFFGTDRVIAVLPNALNPTVEKFGDWAHLEGRHHGTILDDKGKRRRAKADTFESKVTPANCHLADSISLLAAQNPINASYQLGCQNCFDNWRCGKESGDGYGARYQASLALKQPLIITSYGRLHGGGAEAGLLDNTALILDESKDSVVLTNQIKVSRQDIKDKYVQVDRSGVESLQRLKLLLNFLSGDGWQEGDRYYGINKADLLPLLREYLKNIDWAALDNLEDDEEELKAFGLTHDVEKLTDSERRRLTKLTKLRWLDESDQRDFDQLLALSDRSPAQNKRLRIYKSYALTPELETERDALQERYEGTRREYLSASDMRTKAAFLTKRWLKDFLLVVTSESYGHVHWGNDGITLTLPNDQHLSAIKKAKKVVLVSASELRTKAEIAQKYDVLESEVFIFQVKEKKTVRAKVEIVQVTGLGKLGKNRGKGLEECRQALIAKLKELDPSHAHFDKKGFEADGVLFRDSVGSNDYERCKSISTTVPRPNINASLAEYCTANRVTVNSDDQGFQTYYQNLIQESLIQWRGRLREASRGGESLTAYIIADEDLPIPVDRTIAAADICPEAARKGERGVRAIAAAAQWVLAQGQELTQSAVARATAILSENGKKFSQQYVQKVWGRVLDCLQLILGSNYKKSCRVEPPAAGNVETLIPMIEEIALTGDPRALDEVILWFSPAEWAIALELLSESTKQLLIQCWVSLLPTGMVEAIA